MATKTMYTRPITYRDLFKMQRNKVNLLVKCAREAYYKTKLQQCGSSTKDSRRTLKSLLGQERGNEVRGEFLICESVTTDKHVIVEEFDQYFTSVGSKTAEAYQEPSDYNPYLRPVNENLNFVSKPATI